MYWVFYKKLILKPHKYVMKSLDFWGQEANNTAAVKRGLPYDQLQVSNKKHCCSVQFSHVKPHSKFKNNLVKFS